jgi:poly-gamma-glutamate capsule biosynthesis protein CapA/YwtB (metallophosphatase superfamily)
MKFKLSSLILILLTFYKSFSLVHDLKEPLNNSSYLYPLEDSISSLGDTIKIIAVGDIMLGTNYPNKSYLPPNDGRNLLDGVKQFLEIGDLTFGNFEGVIGTGGKPKSCNNPKYCYTFRMPENYISNIKKSGIDLLSIANNHANDFGSGGRRATAKILDSAGLFFAGSTDKPYTIFVVNGVKYGFLSSAPNSGCFNMKSYSKASEYVSMLDSICDIVIVSFHGGAEGYKATHTPKTDEIYLGYNRGSVYKFAHECIDAGADLLLGHGPHVTRAVELYKDRFISYSMGNFCTYARFNLSGPNGVSPIFDIKLNKAGEFISANVIPTKQIGEGIPIFDETKRAWNYIVNLSKEDFPESPLSFDSNKCLILKSK